MTTKTKTAFSDARIYVGTYAKYNDGSIFGKWLDLADYDNMDEFLDACRELHSDEEDPELMFQDWENIPDGLVSECSLNEYFFELREYLEEDEEEAFMVYADYYGIELSEEKNAWKTVQIFRDRYQGRYDSESDFGWEEYLLIEPELPEIAKMYFDHEAFTRDLFLSDFTFEKGYVFRDC